MALFTIISDFFSNILTRLRARSEEKKSGVGPVKEGIPSKGKPCSQEDESLDETTGDSDDN